MAAHALTQGTVVAVVGAGCSAPLGYPTWTQLTSRIVELTLQLLDHRKTPDDAELQRVAHFRQRLAAEESPSSQELMFYLGACKTLVERAGAVSDCDRTFRDLFSPAGRDAPADANPHRALLSLQISRFVTTNYDCALEQAIAAERRVDFARFGVATSAPGGADTKMGTLSFTQQADNCSQLARFALAVEEAKNMVFHCHGRFDVPGSIIASEADYQRWYLRQSPDSPPYFLQTIDLLFESNPILFVGYGLGDEDLLRPLRRIAASAPERRPYRPLFALLSDEGGKADSDRHDRMFERYGLNVLTYNESGSEDPVERGRDLSAALRKLESYRLEWRDGWLEKPRFRRVTVSTRPPEPYRHYDIDTGSPWVLGERRVGEEVASLVEFALDRARVILIVGPGGTGKSWHATRLLEELTHRGGFESFFFWSSYYADDALTGLDRLVAYIDPEGDRKESRLARIRRALSRGRHAIVFDGFERLLRPSPDDPEVGLSNDPIVKKFLEICSAESSGSTLIVTSRLWPAELPRDEPRVRFKPLERLRTDDLLAVEIFRRLDRDQVSMLCALLEGHAYASLLAGRFLGFVPTSRLEQQFVLLRRALAATPPDRRLGTVIRLVLDAVDEQTFCLARPMLARLAVFMSPVTDATLAACFALAEEEMGLGGDAGTAEADVVDRLLEAQLIFRVVGCPGGHEPAAYTVHPTVRSFVFEGSQQVERDVLPNFTLAGFTSGKAAVHPGSTVQARWVSELFTRLHRDAQVQVEAGRHDKAVQLCRSLFGVVRSRMEANTAPRWCSYQDYLGFGVRVIDLAKSLSTRWLFRERHELDEVEDAASPLYADEVAFCYNDVGLALCAEGFMRDTLDVWEQGYEINRLLEGMAEVPLYSLQSQLHLGHTFIEIGDLKMASQYLEETKRTNFKVSDVDYGARILGYQALVAHYRNHIEEADHKYKEALRQLRASGGNARAESYFLCHRSKLAITRHDFDRALRYINSSRALALASGAVDLVGYARAALGRWHREQGRFAEAIAEYQSALALSKEKGIHRLEAEILTGLSRTALLLGDGELARQRAMAALAIGNELGLGLRITQGLLALGLAMRQVGQAGLGGAYLRLARDLGSRQEYWLRSREAELALAELGDGSVL